ncbi:long-chain acyl-CoA synthetase [Caldalkalibacillus uzonensis]|uniref:Long-chain acyl-CoA synthetase n=1 Tax=Caldalkalibacillus uzonensis TaxID=353224 RepID=A0ABU0CQS9_9BACI|nr:class I adenylate-forming enzyme family protein [Caldalkalibacillus uzonensis]MDQ0337367.1 long-chain acyl-CoA synthetase [Caldalkalibacillus uzonensis]
MKMDLETHFGRNVYVYPERPGNIADMLFESAQKYQDKVALVSNDHRLSYGDFWVRSEHIAGNLQKQYGIFKGDRIAVLLGNSIEFALIVFACARLGAILVPLNTRLQEKELKHMILNSKPKAIFVDEEFVPKMNTLKNEVNQLNAHYFLIGKETSSDYLSFKQLEQQSQLDTVSVHEDDPFFLMYTSGTTGLPKGALGTHLGVIHSVLSYENVLKTNALTKTLIAVPLFHVTGLIGQLIHMVRVGGTSVLMRRYKTDPFLELISKEKISFLFNVPSIYIMMMSSEQFRLHEYSSVTCIAYGGASMPTEAIFKLRKYFPHAHLHNCYGATETSSPTTIMPQKYDDSKLASVGKPVPGAELKIVNEDGEEQPLGEEGELLIKGPMVIGGYWKNKQANKAAFVEGYWRSGDMAKIDEDGFVYILDRKKDMINRGGEKVYSIEVENVLHQHPDILEAAVIGIPHPIYGEVVKAFVVTNNKLLSEDNIKEFVSEKLADYKVPAKIEFLSQLPRNPGGKVLKHTLKNAQ